VFENPDGTQTARIYTQPVHYKTSSGAWANIDTTLVQQADSTWQEQANSSSPVFAAAGDSSALMTTPLGPGESMSFSLQGAAAVTGTTSGNVITYPGILPDASIAYAANAAGVKETLVLNNASAPTTWTFPLALQGLSAALDSDGAVVLSDSSGNTVLTIPHGFMRDSNIDPASNDGAQSNGVTYTLTTVAGQQALRVDLDPAWVHDPARVFPIDVDPTSINITASTYVMSQFTNDYSTDSVLKAGTFDGGTHVANSYLLFHSFGTEFANDYIEAATLNLNTVHSWSCDARPVNVSAILSTWSPTGLKTYPWVSYGATLGTSSFAAGFTGCGAQWESIDLGDNPSAAGTKLLEQWAHGGSNLGLAVTASKTDDFGYKEFSSVNTPFPPYLSVTYSPFGADYRPAGTYVTPTATVAGSQQVTVKNEGRTAWAPGTVSLGYQLFTTSFSRISVGATTTALPASVAPNSSISLTGKIGALAPGQYILCWDMMTGTSSFNVTYGVPTSTCEVINSSNTPPQIDSMSPLSNSTLGTLTPILSATGHDPDNFPGSGLKYDFQIYTAPPSGAPSLVVDSGLLAAGVSQWRVPTGKLAWNQTYFWEVLDSDGDGSSFWSNPDYFSVAVQQPLITSHLGSAASGRSADPGVGDYTTSATDAQVSVVGPALSVVRSYNSQDPRTDNLFGAGWSTVYDMSAIPDSDGSGNVVVTYPDGHAVRFGLNSDGTTFTPPAGTYATFLALLGGGYSLTDRGGTTYTFTTAVGSAWKLSSITDADHRSETLTYTAGQLTTITNTASNRSLHLTWSGGHPASVTTDPVTVGGQPLTWTYSFTGSALTTVCPPTSTTQCSTYGYTSGTGSGSHFRSTVLDAQPTAYWRLNDPNGNATAVDEVAANMGTDNGTYGTTFGHDPGMLPGSPTKAAFFGGTNGVTLPNNLVASTSDTVQLWFQTAAGGPAGVLLSTGTSPLLAANPSTNSLPLLYVGADGKLYGQWWTGSVAPIVSGGAVNDGNWHQVTLVGAGATQSMYLDGALVGTRAGQIKNIGPTEFIGGGYVNGNAWVQGPGTGWRFFTGHEAEVAFYSHALGAPAIAQQYAAGTHPAVELTSVTTPNGSTAAQIAYDNVTDRTTQLTDQHGGAWTFHAPVTTGSTVGFRGAILATSPIDYWPFGEASGAQADNVLPVTAIQQTTSNGAGDYANVMLGAPGPFPNAPDTAAGFDGSTSSVSFTEAQMHGAVGLWFKTTTAAGVLVDYGGVPELYIGTDGKLHADYGGSGLLSSKVVTDGAWHYVVLSEQFFDAQTLYLDGVVADSATPDTGYPNGTDYPLVIGAGTVPGTAAAAPANGHFTGSVADVTTYQQISDDQVTAVYTAGHAASTSSVPVTTVTVTDPSNATLRDSYDPLHGGRVTTTTDGLGNTTRYDYDANGFPKTVTRPDGDSVDTGYDSRGNLLQRDTGFASFSAYTYPAQGTYATTDPRDDEPITSTDGDGHQTTYTYSPGGDLLTSSNALGAVTTDTYTAGTESAVGGGTEPPGLLATQRDPLGHVTTYAYDSAGDLARVVAASGLTTTYTTDNLGRRTGQTVVSDTFPAGVTTSYSYDGLSRLVTQTGPATTDAVTSTVHTPLTTNAYDADGDLLSSAVSDTTGGDATRTTTDTYNGDDELASTTDPAGRKTLYGYDAYGNNTTATDPAGNVYTNTYDANGDLLTSTLHNWTGNSATPATPTDLVVDSRAYDPDGLLASDTDAMGRVTEYTYDWEHRLETDDHVITQPDDVSDYGDDYGYDEAGNVTVDFGPSGDLGVEYTYDAANRPVSAVATLGGELPDSAGSYEHLDRTTNYTYDLDNNLTSQSTVNGSVTEQTDYTYDALGDQTTQAVHDGSTTLTTSSTYDQRGVQTSVTDPRGNVAGADPAAYTTDYTTDSLGRTVMVVQPTVNAESQGGAVTAVHPITEYGYDTFGDQTSMSDPDGNITSDTFDLDGEPIGVSQPAYTPPGSTSAVTPTTAVAYDSLGQATTVTDPLGHVTTNTYDQLGDLVQQAQPVVNGASPTTKYTYDNDGEALSMTGPTGAQTQATYDDIGQVLTTTQVERHPTPAAYITQYTYNLASYQRDDPETVTDPLGQTTSLTWDQGGQLLSSTDPLGNVVVNNYDTDLQPIKTTLPDGSATTSSYDPAGRQTGAAQLDAAGTPLRSMGAAYDPAGNQTSSTDAQGVITTTSYDAVNRSVSQTQPVSASASITTSTGYDAAGNPTRYTSGDGNATIYTYNTLGLPESRIDPSVAGYTTTADRTTTTSYDANGDATGITEPGGVTDSMAYDPLGRLTSQSGAGAEAPTATRTLGYDPAGRLTSVNAPSGADTYTYDDRGDLLTAGGPSGTTGYSYNGDDQLTARTDATGTATYTYDQAGRLSTQFDPLTGTTATYSYNPVDQVTGVSYGSGAASQTDTYNAEHQLTGQSLASGSGSTEASISYGYDPTGRITSQTSTGIAGASTNTYGYDQAGRLTSWNNGTNTVDYGYDADGNRTLDGTITATFNARDQLITSGSTSYSYTARGTLTGQSTSSTTDSYDAFDQLINAGGTTHSYDGLGRDATDGSNAFTYDGLDTQPSGDGSQQFGYGSNGELDSVSAGGVASLTFSDQHGDVTGLFSAGGTALVGSQSYDPWGQPLATGGTQADLGYQGGWTDPTTGDVGTASRWYDPSTATFTSRDTNPLDPSGTAVSANSFAYGNDDPLDVLDPTGLSGCASGGGSGHVSGSGGSSGGGSGQVSGSASGGGRTLGWAAGIEIAILSLVPILKRLGGGLTGGSRGGEITGGAPEDGVGVDGGGGNSDAERLEPVSCVSQRLPSTSRLQGALSGSAAGGIDGGDHPGHPKPPPPPLGDTKPINAKPTGQSVPSGDIVTRQLGTKTPDSGPADAPVNTGLTGEINSAAKPTSAFQAVNTQGPAGANTPGPLPPAQAQLDAAECTGQQARADGSVSALICDGGASDSTESTTGLSHETNSATDDTSASGAEISFYTVQSPAAAARLRTGGHPFPTEANRAHLGPGVYSWAMRADAESYAANKPGAEILEFSISDNALAEFKQAHLGEMLDDAATDFMEKYSLLWDGDASHGLDYISRPTARGVEHYFSSSIFDKLRFWK
jgi:RHS repeat-associated protein